MGGNEDAQKYSMGRKRNKRFKRYYEAGNPKPTPGNNNRYFLNHTIACNIKNHFYRPIIIEVLIGLYKSNY